MRQRRFGESAAALKDVPVDLDVGSLSIQQEQGSPEKKCLPRLAGSLAEAEHSLWHPALSAQSSWRQSELQMLVKGHHAPTCGCQTHIAFLL